MSLSPQTELLIQRCVDNELSPGDTRQLLRQLDSITDGWKSLACGLLEDRQLRLSLGPASQSPVAADITSLAPVAAMLPAIRPGDSMTFQTPAGVRHTSTARLRHWWNHPVTSLSLCAAIAFVGGMLVSDDPSQPLPNTPGHSAAMALPARSSGFTVQLPGDVGSGQVPVYESLGALRQSFENHPLLHDFRSDPSMRLLVVPTTDGRTIVVPIDRSQQQPLQ
jgi:hypothetical protein